MMRKTRIHNASAIETDERVIADFYTASGWLSMYALGCGYQEKIFFPRDGEPTRSALVAGDRCVSLNLWLEGVFHVRAHEHGGRGRIFWESFDTVQEARAYFTQALKKAEKGLL